METMILLFGWIPGGPVTVLLLGMTALVLVLRKYG
jgi:hypothetical protein